MPSGFWLGLATGEPLQEIQRYSFSLIACGEAARVVLLTEAGKAPIPSMRPVGL